MPFGVGKVGYADIKEPCAVFDFKNGACHNLKMISNKYLNILGPAAAVIMVVALIFVFVSESPKNIDNTGENTSASSTIEIGENVTSTSVSATSSAGVSSGPSSKPAVPSYPSASATSLFMARDSRTGYAVSAYSITINNQSVASSRIISYFASLPPGTYGVSVSANGYKSVDSVQVVLPLAKQTYVMLDPVSYDPNRAYADSLNRPSYSVVWGYVSSEPNYKPLQGVMVSTQNGSAASDSAGRFYLSLPIFAGDPCSGYTVRFSKNGYKTFTYTNLNNAINMTMSLSLTPGSGEVIKDMRSAVCKAKP